MITADYRDLFEDVSLNLGRAHGLANALFFVIQGSEELNGDSNTARAINSLAVMLEDIISTAHELHENSYQLMGARA